MTDLLRRLLSRLRRPTESPRLTAADLEPYAGNWVVIRGGKVRHAVPTARDAVEYCRANRISATLVFVSEPSGEPVHVDT